MTSKKRTSLDAVFGATVLPTSSDAPKSRAKIRTEPTTGAKALPTIEVEQGSKVAMRSKRPAVKQHTAYLPLPVHEQLRKLAFEENRKIHDYLMEGLDRVFADRGLPAAKDIK